MSLSEDFVDQTKYTNELHGSVIMFNGLDSMKCIPRRRDLLDKSSISTTDSIICGDKPGKLLFLPNSFKEFHEKIDGSLKYGILIFGILPDGRKASVILEGIIPYFEVRKPDSMREDEFRKKTQSIVGEKYRGTSVEEIRKKGFYKYEHEKTLYLRIHFTNLWDRKSAIKYFAETLQWQTTTDDNNNYVRVACRNNNFSMCAWNEILHHESFKKEDVCKLSHTFRVNYKNFIKYEGDISLDTKLYRDLTMIETWDIEAYTNTGEMPDADNADDVVFMIGKTYHWKDSSDSMLDVCIVSRPCNPRPDKLTIVCKNEKDLIKASFILHSIMMPEFIIGFNDGDFDWPFIIKKAVKHKILTYIADKLTLFNDYRAKKQTSKERISSIITWDCQKKTVKLEADAVAYSTTITLPGYINVDVRTMFRKIYPVDPKSSLKHYLSISNLGGKEDMPISELFRIFKESIDLEVEIDTMLKTKNTVGLDDVNIRYENNKEKMADVAHYCTIDAKRCQELLNKVNVIGDKREVSELSHTTVYDAFYYADGMKVRNMVISEGQKRGLLFSTRIRHYICNGKYPGAHVFHPIKGVVKPKLTVRERKANLQEWKDVSDEDLTIMEETIISGDTSTNPCFDGDNSEELFKTFKSEETQHPVPGLDFSSLYPSIIMTHNLSPEYMVFNKNDATILEGYGHELKTIDFQSNDTRVLAWSIKHDTFDGETLLPGKHVNKFGLYPSILKKLMDKRTFIKVDLGKYAKTKEIMEKDDEQNTDEYAKLCFKYNSINSKQKALKVFMNTFYGETGNKLSSFFVLAIAGGITMEGRRNIKMVANILTDIGCKLYYGDTDSCYISCPSKFFAELDRNYYGGKMDKKEYCTKLVLESFKQIDVIKKHVNKLLIEDNGTNFLRMAYEEILYPCIFILKKIYSGVEHKHIVNFTPRADDLFIKGLSFTKRGTSDVLKTVCKEVLMEILDINTTSNAREIVVRKIKDIYGREWDMGDFKQSAVYKPSKNNITVRAFREMMRIRDDPACPMPQPGERFEYVVVKKYPFRYDIKGRKTKIKVGEMWEYYTYAKKNNLEIDLDYYMTGGIIGQFTQFVAYHPEFQVLPTDESQEAYDISEKKTMKKSKKYIETVCNTLSNVPGCKGPVLKELYKLANSTYKKTLVSVFDNSVSIGQIKLMSYECTSGGDLYAHMRSLLVLESRKSAGYYAECFIDYMRNKYGKKIVYTLLKIYTTSKTQLLKHRTLFVARTEDMARRLFMENVKDFMGVFSSRDDIINSMMEQLKSRLDICELDKSACVGDAMPNHKEFGSNPKILDIVECSSDKQKEYSDKLEKQKSTINLMCSIYDTLLASMTYLENTISVVERLRYYASKDRLVNPIPPGITAVCEHSNAMSYIKKNLIEF
jgi:DNA polymerase elongation subunit (family B)